MGEFLFYLRQTFSNIIKNSSIFTTMILSVVLYSFFYPFAYKAERAEQLPLVIVDEQPSLLTQQIILVLSHNPSLNITAVTPNFAQAQYMVSVQRADAILLLPNNLAGTISHNATSGVGLYVSAAYLLRTKQIISGLISSVSDLLQNYAARYAIGNNYHPNIPIHEIPLFNPLSGYASYVFPAVAPLIIHQTIFLGLCMLIGQYREHGWTCSISSLLAIWTAAVLIGCASACYLFGWVFTWFDYPRGGNLGGLLVALPIFVGCVAALGLYVGSFLDSSERAGHVIVFTSIPLFLLSGVAWAHQAMPDILQKLAWLLPSTHGVQMMVQLNQMGVPLADVMPKLYYLLGMMLVLLVLAYRRLRHAPIV